MKGALRARASSSGRTSIERTIRHAQACVIVLAVAGALFAAGCAGGPAVTSAAELPAPPRHPDGVMLDPPAAIPAARDKAPARGVVALREPVGEAEALAVVHDFFQAFVHADKEALRQMLAARATQLDAHGAGSAESLRAAFEMRMRTVDYTRLAGTELYRVDQIERYAYDELGEGSTRPRPGEMQSGDLLVRIPMLTARVGSDRLFGDVVVLLLRREDGRFKVAGYGEDSAP